MRKYIILTPIFQENDTIMNGFIKKHIEKNVKYDVLCVLRL